MRTAAVVADYFHKANPAVECSYSGVEGLQREFGHDRVSTRLGASTEPGAVTHVAQPAHSSRGGIAERRLVCGGCRAGPLQALSLAPPDIGNVVRSGTVRAAETHASAIWHHPATALQAYIILNMTADLRSEFTWNTKQIFAYVNIEFETERNRKNQMVMWSSIIEKRVGGTVQGGGRRFWCLMRVFHVSPTLLFWGTMLQGELLHGTSGPLPAAWRPSRAPASPLAGGCAGAAAQPAAAVPVCGD